MYFAGDGESGITLYGGSQTQEAQHDFSRRLNPGERFGNLTYKQLEAAQQGTILWNPAHNSGEILAPNDPRWDRLYPKAQQRLVP